MPIDRLDQILNHEVEQLHEQGVAKGDEDIIVKVLPARGQDGPRYLLAGCGDRPFIRMNSNAYLGMPLRKEIIEAEERGSRQFGAGPGAVRFISGTFAPHVELEGKLAAFHDREAAMIFSSAYATVMGVLTPLITADTVVVSDALNHNCIINAMRLSRPGKKVICEHNDPAAYRQALTEAAGEWKRAIVVTDGVFSMRGDWAPLAEIARICAELDEQFPENVVLVVDDSHGVGAWGETGRGTEEIENTRADILIGTLGKAFGVNGGYVATSRALAMFLRERAPFYIYSNPITPGEAAAAAAVIDLVDSAEGRDLLAHLNTMTERFSNGLTELGYETIPGPHPVVPLMVRDTERTTSLVAWLKDHGVLGTGLNYPVVPHGDQCIRFQVSADHTPADIDAVLDVLRRFADR